MKILHTADWHLGKKLYRTDLGEDHEAFFRHLIHMIEKEKVQLLLISGDVFDLANPSTEARKLYYNVLVQLSRLNCQVIVTGGNHDSPSVLNAPKEILKALNIHVIGGLTDKIEDMIIPVYDKNGETVAVVAAVPFLRDADLRQMAKGDTYEDRLQAVREGIATVFNKVAAYCADKHPGIPALAMGHLYAHGASVSDSEREIQIGNAAGFESEQFPSYFKYIALGHIHRPQQVGKTGTIFYSGSPIPLSFSERKDEKRVILMDIEADSINMRSIAIPQSRRLLHISGTFSQLTSKLDAIKLESNPTFALIELEMLEEQYNPQKIVDLEQMLANFNCLHAEVVKHRLRFANQVSGSAALFDPTQNIENLEPSEVFNKRLEQEQLPENDQQLLKDAFSEVLEMVQQDEKAGI